MNEENLKLVGRATIEATGNALLMASVVIAIILPERHFASGGEDLIYPGAAYAIVFAMLIGAARLGVRVLLSPALTVSSILRGNLDLNTGMMLAAAQIAGAFAGVIAAQAALNLDAVQSPLETHLSVSELLTNMAGTFLFVLVMMRAEARGDTARGAIAGLALFAVYVATPGGCFANPAVTLARTLTSNALSLPPVEGFALAAGEVLAAWLAVLAAQRFAAVGRASTGP